MQPDNEIEMWNNGPLPLMFKSNAYLAKNEFALPKKDALDYLRWCNANGCEVSGYEVWFPTNPGPTVLVGHGGSGNADFCHERILKDNFEKAEKTQKTAVVFNIWAECRLTANNQ